MTRTMVLETCPVCQVQFRQGAKFARGGGQLGKTCPGGHWTSERELRLGRIARGEFVPQSVAGHNLRPVTAWAGLPPLQVQALIALLPHGLEDDLAHVVKLSFQAGADWARAHPYISTTTTQPRKEGT